jgi:N6-adenosine-specific RNA methylase IME4
MLEDWRYTFKKIYCWIKTYPDDTTFEIPAGYSMNGCEYLLFGTKGDIYDDIVQCTSLNYFVADYTGPS